MVGGGSGDQRFGGEDVVGDGGQGLFFEEGNVFEGGGVKDEARTVQRKDLVEKRAVGDAAEIEGWRAAIAEIGKVALKIVEVVFRRFKKNDVRACDCETECKRGADGAAGAGNEDGLRVRMR